MTKKSNLSDVKGETSRVNPMTMRGMRNPLREFSKLQQSVSRLFDEFIGPFYGTHMPGQLIPGNFMPGQEITFAPACDIDMTDNQYIMSFDLPGVSKENIKIEILDNQLVVSGVIGMDLRSDEKINKLSSERFHGTFQRVFTLPTTVDPGKIEASYKDGILQIAIPRMESAKGRVVEIKHDKDLSSKVLTQKKDTSEKAA